MLAGPSLCFVGPLLLFNIMFVSLADKIDQTAVEIFEALDLDSGDSSEYLKEKCNDIPKETLIRLRDKRFGNEGRTLLHNAARCGSLSTVLFLIRLGHEIEPIDSSLSKITPLMDAISNQFIEIAIVLVEYGAQLTTQDINGENALHYVARTGCSRLVKWLIKAANLSKAQIQEVASTSNIKLKFPEDLASNSLTREVLVSLRETGMYVPAARRKEMRSRK